MQRGEHDWCSCHCRMLGLLFKLNGTGVQSKADAGQGPHRQNRCAAATRPTCAHDTLACVCKLQTALIRHPNLVAAAEGGAKCDHVGFGG